MSLELNDHESATYKNLLVNNLELVVISQTKYPQQNLAKQYYPTKNNTTQLAPPSKQRVFPILRI